MENYQKLFDAGNAAQLEKLKKNEHKNGYENIAVDFALKKIDEEYNELMYVATVIPLNGDGYSQALKNIRREAADLANFCHMLIYKMDQLIKED